MIDRIFSAVLTFGLLIGATLAIGSELFAPHPAHVAAIATAHAQVVQLERVEPTAQRAQ